MISWLYAVWFVALECAEKDSDQLDR